MTDPIDTITNGLAVADKGLSLVERLAALIKPNPTRKAARLLARAGRLNARALTATPRRAEKLHARADALVRAARALT